MIYEFTPTQDLHGYSEPWAPGAGKNLFSYYNLYAGYWLSSGFSGSGDPVDYDSQAASQNAQWLFVKVPVTEGDVITLSGMQAMGGTYSAFFGDSPSDVISLFLNTSQNGTKTVPEGAKNLGICIHLGGGEAVPNDPKTLFPYAQVELGSVATTFAPYENICPPEGYNIWDPLNAQYVQVYAGYVNSNTRELYLRPVYSEYAGEELVGPWMSSLDEYSEGATPTEGAFVIDFGGELESFEITPFMLQTLLESLGIRQHFTDGAGLLNSLMDQAQGRVRSEEELLHLSRPLKVIAIGDQLPAGITFKPISKDVLPGLPGKFIR